MNRRQLLVSGGAVALSGLAGCLGDDDTDGYPTDTFDGTEVPLAPLADVYEWYEDEDAEFVDARSQHEYDQVRIQGAVFSPQPHGLEENDPVDEWATDTTIVTYCVCPHAQAGMRAASLLDDGYEDVYALDDGLRAWIDEGYPIAGTRVEERLPAYDVEGRTDPDSANEYAWVRHSETGQREPGKIDADGRYEMTLHFTDVDADSLLEVETPDYTKELTLEELTSDVVTA